MPIKSGLTSERLECRFRKVIKGQPLLYWYVRSQAILWHVSTFLAYHLFLHIWTMVPDTLKSVPLILQFEKVPGYVPLQSGGRLGLQPETRLRHKIVQEHIGNSARHVISTPDFRDNDVQYPVNSWYGMWLHVGKTCMGPLWAAIRDAGFPARIHFS